MTVLNDNSFTFDGTTFFTYQGSVNGKFIFTDQNGTAYFSNDAAAGLAQIPDNSHTVSPTVSIIPQQPSNHIPPTIYDPNSLNGRVKVPLDSNFVGYGQHYNADILTQDYNLDGNISVDNTRCISKHVPYLDDGLTNIYGIPSYTLRNSLINSGVFNASNSAYHLVNWGSSPAPTLNATAFPTVSQINNPFIAGAKLDINPPFGFTTNPACYAYNYKQTNANWFSYTAPANLNFKITVLSSPWGTDQVQFDALKFAIDDGLSRGTLRLSSGTYSISEYLYGSWVLEVSSNITDMSLVADVISRSVNTLSTGGAYDQNFGYAALFGEVNKDYPNIVTSVYLSRIIYYADYSGGYSSHVVSSVVDNSFTITATNSYTNTVTTYYIDSDTIATSKYINNLLFLVDYPRKVYFKGTYIPSINLGGGWDQSGMMLTSFALSNKDSVTNQAYQWDTLGFSASYSGTIQSTPSSSPVDQTQGILNAVFVDEDGFVGVTPFNNSQGINVPIGNYYVETAAATSATVETGKVLEDTIQYKLGLTFQHPTVQVGCYAGNLTTIPTNYATAKTALTGTFQSTGNTWYGNNTYTLPITVTAGKDISIYLGFFCESTQPYTTRYDLSRPVLLLKGYPVPIEAGFVSGSFGTTLGAGEFKLMRFVIPYGMYNEYCLKYAVQSNDPTGLNISVMFLNPLCTDNTRLSDPTVTYDSRLTYFPDFYNLIFKDFSGNWLYEYKEGKRNYPNVEVPRPLSAGITTTVVPSATQAFFVKPAPDGINNPLTTLTFGAVKVADVQIDQQIKLRIVGPVNKTGLRLKISKPTIPTTLTGYSTIGARVAPDYFVVCLTPSTGMMSSLAGGATTYLNLPDQNLVANDFYEVVLWVTFDPTSYISNYIPRSMTIQVVDSTNTVLGSLTVSGSVTG